MTTAKHVSTLQSFGERVLATANRLGGVQCFEDCFDHRKARGRLAELWRVRFYHFKASRRLAEVLRVRFLFRNAFSKLAEDRTLVLITASRVESLQNFGEWALTMW